MKIAVASIRFDTLGGSERRTWQLVKGLVGAGHQVEIFAARAPGIDLPVKVNIVPMLPGPSFLKILSFTANLRDTLAGRGDIDIVHNQIRPFTKDIVTVGGGCHAEYLERTGKRLHFINPRDIAVLGMERENYRDGGCRAVITNSELAKAGILRFYPIPPERVSVAYNGVDHERFNPEAASSSRAEIRARFGLLDEPVALFMGAGFRRKGLVTLIKALPLVKTMDREINRLKVLVAGSDAPGPYMRLAGRLGVSDRLIFTGHTASPDKFYGAADIFVLPTKYDPFSNSALEAMACGLPVITTAANGVSEIIEDGVNGFVLDNPEDFAGLAATLGYLSCEKARRKAGDEASNTAKGFTWDKTLDKTLEVYRASM
ncbi:MAG: glycosyltransferase family 4 protein [Nitrospirota bacterium]